MANKLFSASREFSILDLIDGVVLAGVVGDFNANLVAGARLVDHLAVDLDFANRLREVARMALDVDPVARAERAAGDSDSGDLNLAEVMGYGADRFFAHGRDPLGMVRMSQDVAATEVDPRAADATHPASELEQRDVKARPTARAGNSHWKIVSVEKTLTDHDPARQGVVHEYTCAILSEPTGRGQAMRLEHAPFMAGKNDRGYRRIRAEKLGASRC